MNKYIVFLFSLVLATLFAYMYLGGPCLGYSFDCSSLYLHYALVILWAPILLFFSVMTFFTQSVVFDRWVKFSLPWIIFSSVAVFFIPLHTVGVNWEAILAFALGLIFFLASAFIVARRHDNN